MTPKDPCCPNRHIALDKHRTTWHPVAETGWWGRCLECGAEDWYYDGKGNHGLKPEEPNGWTYRDKRPPTGKLH